MTYSCCITELIVILNCIVIIEMAGQKPTIPVCPHCAQCFLSTKKVELLTTWKPVLEPVVHTLYLTCAVGGSPPRLLYQDFFLVS